MLVIYSFIYGGGGDPFYAFHQKESYQLRPPNQSLKEERPSVTENRNVSKHTNKSVCFLVDYYYCSYSYSSHSDDFGVVVVNIMNILIFVIIFPIYAACQ